MDHEYDEIEKEREYYTNMIIDSKDRYRIVAAGPGTGKTYTMLKILEMDTKKNYLVLTLTNELITDLNADLGKHANCKTFHKFCWDIYKNDMAGRYFIYPYMADVIERDAEILGLATQQIDAIRDFSEEGGELIKAYFKRIDYYGAIDFDGMTYKVAYFLIHNPDRIRNFDLVLIDEYQDFTKLETELLSVLENINSILITGDDDQSLYQFRGANPKFIREKYSSNKYKKFTLPYCVRCPEVIVNAVKNILQLSESEKIITNRIDKIYKCYMPTKKEDSVRYPNIFHIHVTVQRKNANYMGKYILGQINRLKPEFVDQARKSKKTLILVLGERRFLNQVYEFLKKNIINISSEEIRYCNKKEPANWLLDALRFINKKGDSNLGWRIVIEDKLSKPEFVEIIRGTANKFIYDFVPDDLKRHVSEIIGLLKTDSHTTEEIKSINDFFNTNDIEKILKSWRTDLEENEDDFDNSALINLTTIESSKGLSADYVFIVGLQNDADGLNRNITESDICKFIVALTRTKKQCQIITSGLFGGKIQSPSPLISWIPKGTLIYDYIDKDKLLNYKVKK